MLLNIITVTKDDLEGLKKTIDSTSGLRQNPEVLQIIVDSSGVETQKVIKEHIRNEINIKYLWEPSSGVSSAFNMGIKNANAKWLWFLNGGDEAANGLNIDNFIYLLSNIKSDAIIFQIKESQSGITHKHPPMWALWPPLLSWIPHPSVIMIRELYEKYGNFDESYKIAMDYEFWLRCFSKDVIVDLVTIPISKFDQSGISNKLNDITKSEVRRAIRKYFWLIIKRWLSSALIIAKSIKASSGFFK
jgi:glycosyltransferase involved in cell wall biosynthesis